MTLLLLCKGPKGYMDIYNGTTKIFQANQSELSPKRSLMDRCRLHKGEKSPFELQSPLNLPTANKKMQQILN